MIEKYKKISEEIKNIEYSKKESKKLRKDIFEHKKYFMFCLKLFGVLFLIPIFISISGFLEIESVFTFREQFDSFIVMNLTHLPLIILVFSLLFGLRFSKKLFFRILLLSFVLIFIYHSILSPNFVYFASSFIFLMCFSSFLLMKSFEKNYSKKAENSKEKLALLKKERSLTIDKIMNDSEYLQKLLSNEEEDKTMREIYSNITKEKEWKEQLLTLSKKESIDCLENT